MLVVVVVVTLFLLLRLMLRIRAPISGVGLVVSRLCVCVYNFVLEMEMMMGYHKVINRFCTILCSA